MAATDHELLLAEEGAPRVQPAAASLLETTDRNEGANLLYTITFFAVAALAVAGFIIAIVALVEISSAPAEIEDAIATASVATAAGVAETFGPAIEALQEQLTLLATQVATLAQEVEGRR